jgi:hypothetical protein
MYEVIFALYPVVRRQGIHYWSTERFDTYSEAFAYAKQVQNIALIDRIHIYSPNDGITITSVGYLRYL